MTQDLKLHSPAGSDPVYYKWPLVITNTRDEAAEITESIRWVCEDFPELSVAFQNIIMKEYDPECYESMAQLCNRYNKAIDGILQLWKGRAPPPKMFKRPGRQLLRHIINVCYNHAVTDPEKLNIYEPFSPEVYGETSFDMVSQMIDEVNFGNNDTFMDLGSGVGQVVLQVAASINCKECYGIEKAETPAQFAVAMEREFKKWMAWFGKTYSPFKLEKGDFLQDETGKRITETSVIFVNNFAFGPKVNHQLKIRFQGLKEGAKVISSREYCPIYFKFNSRNLSELGAMMRVTEIKPRSQAASVSWTGKGVSYYLHVVDRTRLEKYFSILKKKKEGLPLDDDERSICSESNNSSMFESAMDGENDAEKLEDNLDALYLGATTRHQWQVLVSTLQASKKEHAEKEALDKEERQAASLKKRKKFIKGSKQQNLQGKLKKKIMEKYEKQKRIKEILKENSTTAKRSRGRPVKNKPGHLSYPSKKKSMPLDEAKISRDLDHHFASMKSRYMKFIRKMNSKAYADKIKLMIEYEMVRKKFLQKQVMESEFEVDDLLRNSLQLFSKRIEEAGMAVQTPQDVLNKSTALAMKHQHLKDQVMSMETQVSILENKQKSITEKRELQLRLSGVKDLNYLNTMQNKDQVEDKELPNKLCGAIIASLNHRKNLLQEYKDVKEQVKVLESITDSSDSKRTAVDLEINKTSVKKKRHNDEDKKQKPVALVPPRMLGNNGTISPMSSEIKRRKQKKKSKRSLSPLSSYSDSVIQENRPRQCYPRYSYPPDPSMFSNQDTPWITHHGQPFCSGEHSYSMYQSSEPFAPNWPSEGRGHVRNNNNTNQDPASHASRSHDVGFSDFYQNSHSFLDATRSLLGFNDHGMNYNHHDIRVRQKTGERGDIINSNFPVNISTEQPFWQQYSNLAKATAVKSKVNSKSTTDARLSDNSSTETASVSSQEESPARGIPSGRPLSSEPKMTENSKYLFPRNWIKQEANVTSKSNKSSSPQHKLANPTTLSMSNPQTTVLKSEPGHFLTASQSDTKRVSNAYCVSKLISSQPSPINASTNSLVTSATKACLLKDHLKSSKKVYNNLKYITSCHQSTLSSLSKVANMSSPIDHIALNQVKQTAPKIRPPNVNSSILSSGKVLNLSGFPSASSVSKLDKNGKSIVKVEKSLANSTKNCDIQSKPDNNKNNNDFIINPNSGVRISESATHKPNKPIVQSMTIYKPGSASGKKSKQAKKQAGSLHGVPSTGTIQKSNVYTPVLSSQSEDIVYRNPIMTILPSHSRLLVLPNGTNAPSTATTSASYSAVFYINSSNATKSNVPIAANNGNQQVTISSAVSIAKATASTAVLSKPQSPTTKK